MMEKFKNTIFSLTVAPLFLGWAFVLNLLAANLAEARLISVTLPLLAVFLLILIIFLVSLFLLKNRTKASVFTSLFAIIFFSYGEVLGIFRKIPLFPVIAHFGRNNLLAIIFSLLLILILFLVWKTKRNLCGLVKLFSIMGFLLLILPLFNIWQFQIKNKDVEEVASPMVLPNINKETVKQPLRDIYYLVPEDYSAASIYQSSFNADISGFTNFLKDKGFYVAEKSTSNYPKSFESIASTLNLEYLDHLSKFKKSYNQSIVIPLFNNNNVLKMLRPLGYKYYQMGSWWEPTRFNPLADQNFILENKNLHNLDAFSYAVLQSTILNPLVNRYLPKVVLTDSDFDKRKRIFYQFSEFSNVAALPGPKFVFLHVIAPHGPYVLDQNCKSVGRRTTNKLSEEQNYVNQTICINQKFKELINNLLQKKPKPIILLQTDEGAPFLGEKVKPKDNWKTADTALLKEKFPIIAAYYLPEVSHKILYPEISAVNAFRVIFDLYFKTNLGLLPDKNFIFSDLNDLYNFKDVTDQVTQ